MEDEYNLSNIIGKRLEAALGELGEPCGRMWCYPKRHFLYFWRHQLPD